MDWVDDSDSRVDILATARADLRGIARMAWGLSRDTIQVPSLRDASPGQAPAGARGVDLRGQVLRFIAVGVASTLAYLLIYLGLRGFMAAQAANAVSLLVTAVGNTAVNRRFTFGIRGRADSARHQARGLIAFGTGLLLTSAALDALHMISARPSRMAEVTVLLIANLAATVVRFVLYRRWVFRRKAPPATSQPATAAASTRPADLRPSPSTLLQPEGTGR